MRMMKRVKPKAETAYAIELVHDSGACQHVPLKAATEGGAIREVRRYLRVHLDGDRGVYLAWSRTIDSASGYLDPDGGATRTPWNIGAVTYDAGADHLTRSRGTR
jgi:hypothetical protein